MSSDSMANLVSASAGRVFHKEESSKEENTKEHLSSVQLYRSTDGKGSTDDSVVNSTMDTKDRRSQAQRNTRLRQDIEIDEYLFSLINEGLVNFKFKAWHARCIYTLGIERYNSVLLDIRDAVSRGKQGSGKPISNPAALFAYKLKGTMQLHAKNQLMNQGVIES